MHPRTHANMRIIEVDMPWRNKRTMYPGAKFCGCLTYFLGIDVLNFIEDTDVADGPTE